MIRKYAAPALLLLGVATFQFVTMPAFFYPGDNVAIRAETANLVNTGELGIDYSRRSEMCLESVAPGQYFYENDAKQKFFSRYGIGDTLLFLPPYAIHKAIHGSVPPMQIPNSLLFILNCYSVLWATASALLLYLIAGLFTSRRWIRVAFTLASLYGTFCAHYLKQPIHENFQITLSLVFFYSSLRFFLHEKDQKPWWNIGVACLATGVLVTTKTSFLLYYAALCVTLLIDGLLKHGKDWKKIIWRPMGKYLLWIGVPALLAIAVLLISNTFRFGEPFNSGYGQWMQNGENTSYFSIAFLKTTIPAFLWNSGNHNIFLHYPLIILALPGLVFLYKKNKSAFWLLLGTGLIYFLTICCYSAWSGEWCYGPRHLIFILMGTGIASLCMLDQILELNPVKRRMALAIFASAAIYSAFLNFQPNRIHPFALYQLAPFFKQAKDPSISNYFTQYSTRANIYRDISLHAAGKKEFPPLKKLRSLPNTEQAYAQLDRIVKFFGRPNYFFCKEHGK